MAENSAQERTEQATQKRKDDARKKGEVLRSRELTIFLSLMSAGAGLMIFGKQIMADLQLFLHERLALTHDMVFSKDGIANALQHAVNDVTVLLLPFLVLMTASMALGPLALGGWTMNPGLLAPKAERISPLKGLARIFSANGLVELVKAIAKFLLVSAMVIGIITMTFDDVLGLSGRPIMVSLAESGKLFTWCFIGFSSVLVLVVALDIPFQIVSFNKKLKMTKQEIKDEMKETEGRPEVKSAIRDRQQEMARQRMMAAVPTADVVITNPTHYAVALKYEEAGNAAPIVVAKGKDLVAGNIRELAKSNGVTIFSAPPLARALYASTDINSPIPENLFLAVAQVLAYVFQLRDAVGGRKPRPPGDLPVPEEYDAMISRGSE